jgi:hypothetical protein
MTNRPKAIGTAAESIVTGYARANGFDGAERLALHGNLDEGDVSLCPGAIAEVKAGKAAETASDAQIEAWLAETETERVNRKADVAVLVLKRKGKGAASAGQWWAILPGWTYVLLSSSIERGDWYDGAYARHTWHSLPPVRITLAEACFLLRYGAYGTPLEGIAA